MSLIITILHNYWLYILIMAIILGVGSYIHITVKKICIKSIYNFILTILLYFLLSTMFISLSYIYDKADLFKILNDKEIQTIDRITKTQSQNDEKNLKEKISIDTGINELKQMETQRAYNNIILVIAISTFFVTIIGFFATFNYFKIKEMTGKIKEADDLKNHITGLNNMLYGNYINQIRENPESGYTWDDTKKYFINSTQNDKKNTSQSYFRLGMIAKGEGFSYDTILKYFQKSKKYYNSDSDDINHADFYINLIKFRRGELRLFDLYQKVQDYDKMPSGKYHILLAELTDEYSLNIKSNHFEKNWMLGLYIVNTVEQLDSQLSAKESVKDRELKKKRIKDALWITGAYDRLIPRQEKAQADNPRNQKNYFELAFAYMCHATVLEQEAKAETETKAKIEIEQDAEKEIDKAVSMFIQAYLLNPCNIYAIINQAFINKQNFERKTGIDLETLKTKLKELESQINDENTTTDLVVVEKALKIQRGTEYQYKKDDLIKSLYNLGLRKKNLNLLFDN